MPFVSRSTLVPFALLATAAIAPLRGAQAQVAYTEGADLSGQNLGTVAVGMNSITGALSVTVSSGFPATVTGDAADGFSFTVPAGVYVTAADMTITNFSSSGTASANPGVRFVTLPPPNFAYCATTSGLNVLAIPAPGRLGPGTHSFEVFTGKSAADTPGTRSFNYTVRFQAEVETGACCNRWTGNCAVMTPAACASVGLRYDGAFATCSPSTCRACPADFNASGATTVQDIFDFLAAYFAGCP